MGVWFIPAKLIFQKLFKKIIINFIKNCFMIFILFVSYLDNFFRRENSYFAVRIFLLPREFLFRRESFSFAVKIFLQKIVLPKVNIFGKPYKKGSGRLCSFCLVLWTRLFYSLGKGEIYRARIFHAWELFSNVHVKAKIILYQSC